MQPHCSEQAVAIIRRCIPSHVARDPLRLSAGRNVEFCRDMPTLEVARVKMGSRRRRMTPSRLRQIGTRHAMRHVRLSL